MTDPRKGATATERDLEWIKKTLEEIKGDLSKVAPAVADVYVTKAEFEPVKRLVYGVVMLILSAVVMALIAQVVVSK